jgi:plasmid stability protein
VELRNITFSLPADLVRQAKVYAAQHDMTVNGLVRELLQEALAREGRARAAADRLLALADQGPYFTTDPSSIRREELYERR